MAQSHRDLLPHRNDVTRCRAGGFEHAQVFAALAHRAFKLVGNVEMFDDGGLSAPGNKDHLFDPCLPRLIDCILDQRTINDR